MTERNGGDFDEQAVPPAVPAGPPESAANAPGPSSHRPQDDKPEPPAAQGPQAFFGAPAPGSGSDPFYQWPDQPAFRHGGPPDDTIVLADRSKALDRTRGRGDTPGPGLDGRAPGEPLGQETSPTPARLEAAQYGGPRPDARGSIGEQPSASGTAPAPWPAVPADRAGPPW